MEILALEKRFLMQQQAVNNHIAYFQAIARKNPLLSEICFYICLFGIVIISYKKTKDLTLFSERLFNILNLISR